MADRELLELAAKAAGLDLTGAYGEAGGCFFLFYREQPDGPPFSWAPLDDDGDALRLAVKLGLAITPYPVYEQPKHSVIATRKNLEHSRYEVAEQHNGDPYAATRRAIVRAAAAIAQSTERSERGRG